MFPVVWNFNPFFLRICGANLVTCMTPPPPSLTSSDSSSMCLASCVQGFDTSLFPRKRDSWCFPNFIHVSFVFLEGSCNCVIWCLESLRSILFWTCLHFYVCFVLFFVEKGEVVHILKYEQSETRDRKSKQSCDPIIKRNYRRQAPKNAGKHVAMSWSFCPWLSGIWTWVNLTNQQHERCVLQNERSDERIVDIWM